MEDEELDNEHKEEEEEMIMDTMNGRKEMI